MTWKIDGWRDQVAGYSWDFKPYVNTYGLNGPVLGESILGTVNKLGFWSRQELWKNWK